MSADFEPAATHPGSWPAPVRIATTGSTNADVAAWAMSGAPEGAVLVTDDQRAGRGRLNRSWTTVPGASLALSVLLRPVQVPGARWTWLPLLVGLAVYDAVREARFDHEPAPADAEPQRPAEPQRWPHQPGCASPRSASGPRGSDCSRTVTLKWPNDVLLGAAKVAGILVERRETPQGPAAVVGVGLNLRADPAFPLGAAALGTPDEELVLSRLLSWLHWHYSRWVGVEGDAAGALRQRYVAACSTIGREVRVQLPAGGELTGWAHDIDTHGRLVVRGVHGEVALAAGDVVHVRPRFP